MSGTRGRKEKSKKKIVLLVIVIAAAALAAMWLLGVFSPPAPARFAADDRAQDIDYGGESREDVLSALQQKADESNFSFKINSRPEFETGDAEGTLYIENPVTNVYDMRVVITLDDTGETIYETGLISPGQNIVRDVLKRQLDAGVYPATATIYAHDAGTGDEIGRTASALELEIKG